MTKSKKEKIEKVQKEIQKDIDIAQVEELIKNNISEFEFEKVKYRTRLPSYPEKQQAYSDKMKRYTELLEDDTYKLEEDLKRIYREKRGINIDEIIARITTLQVKMSNLENKLGKILKEDKNNEKDAEALRKEISRLREEQYALSMRKTQLLQPSIEHQVLIYMYERLAFKITEKLVDKKWVPAWNSYADYLKSPSEVIHRANFNCSMLVGLI